MLDEDGGTLRSVAWSEMFPWLKIYRCFRLAIGIRMLLLGAVAILLTVGGWAVLGQIFSGSSEIQAHPNPGLALSSLVPDRPFSMTRAVEPPDGYLARRRGLVWEGMEPIFGSWEQLSRPWFDVLQGGVSWTRLVFASLCGLWGIAIWAYFGGAITRVAALRLAAEEQIGWTEMLHYASAKWPAYFMAPLFPLIGVLIVAVPIGIVSLLLHVDFGVFLLGLVWWLLLIGGLVMALLLTGLLFGWPLMWATISAEGTDSFDALSRTYAYVFQRPLHYGFFVLVAFLFGILGWLLVANFTAGAVHLTYWAAHWGGSADRVTALATGEGLGGVATAGAVLIRFWIGVLKLLAVGFLFSYFWVAFTAVYFLMRREVDATEMDEVYLEEEQEEEYGLPPLKTDEAGVPVVDEEADQEPKEEKEE